MIKLNLMGLLFMLKDSVLKNVVKLYVIYKI